MVKQHAERDRHAYVCRVLPGISNALVIYKELQDACPLPHQHALLTSMGRVEGDARPESYAVSCLMYTSVSAADAHPEYNMKLPSMVGGSIHRPVHADWRIGTLPPYELWRADCGSRGCGRVAFCWLCAPCPLVVAQLHVSVKSAASRDLRLKQRLPMLDILM